MKRRLDMAHEFTKKVTKKGGKLFIGAVQDYNVEADAVKSGVLTVGFEADKAYVYEDEDEEKIWSADELANFIKECDKKKDGDFPDGYDEYVELMSIADDGINEELKEYYGITDEIEEDIKARLEELSDYTVEKEVNLGDL